MTDTEILNAIEALLDEHFAEGGLGVDMQFGRMLLTVSRPAPRHVPTSQAPI